MSGLRSPLAQVLTRAAGPARLRAGCAAQRCAAARRHVRACSVAADTTAMKKLPEAVTKTVFESPSLLSVEKEVQDYAKLGCILTACGGHSPLWDRTKRC